MAVDLLGIARLNQQKENQKRDAIDSLMTLFEKNALEVDTNDNYNVAIDNIKKLQGQDELMDIVGNERIKKLELEKQYNDQLTAWNEKANIVKAEAKKHYDPSNPTQFLDLIDDLTTSGIRISGKSTRAEATAIENRIKNITAIRKATAMASDERLIADYTETVVPEQDKPLIDLFRKTEASDYSTMKSMAVASSATGATKSSKEPRSWKDFHGLGADPNAQSKVQGYQNDLVTMNTNLQMLSRLASASKAMSPFDIGTENLTTDPKNKRSLNYFSNQKNVMANVIDSFLPSEVKESIEEKYGKSIMASFENGTLEDENGNIVKDEKKAIQMIGLRRMNKKGRYLDTYIEDAIKEMEKDNESYLTDYIKNRFPPKSNTSVGRKQFNQFKNNAIVGWKQAVEMYRKSRNLDNQVQGWGQQFNPNQSIIDPQLDPTSSSNLFNYNVVFGNQLGINKNATKFGQEKTTD